MAKILNSRNSAFKFRFAKSFFYDEVKTKFIDYLKQRPTPFMSVSAFMNSTIQSINIPDWSMNPAEQNFKIGKKTEMKNSELPVELYEKEMTITFKTVDGYINFWIMTHQIQCFTDFTNRNKFLPDMHMLSLDSDGYLIAQVTFINPIFTGITTPSFNFTEQAPDTETFDVTIRYNRLLFELLKPEYE